MRTDLRHTVSACIISMVFASCANYHVRQGDTAFELLAYAKAEKQYDQVLRHHQDRAVLIRAAEACRKQNKQEIAGERYASAEAIAPLSGTDAFHFGQVLMTLQEYDKAADMFARVLQERPEDHVALELYGSCKGYRSFYVDSAQYTVEPMPLSGLATSFSSLPYKGGLLVIGERRATGRKEDPWNGLSFMDLYEVPIDQAGNAGVPVPFKGVVSGAYHEGPAALTDQDSTLYFTRSNYYAQKLIKDADNVSNLKLFKARMGKNGEWQDLREFGYNSDDYSVGHPALSQDGKTLYFVSDMPGGLGGTDIWICEDHGMGWSAPINAGPSINTAGNEMFPTVIGTALYFSSTGHENMGGSDIFEIHKEGERWSEPKNLGYPLNTSHDDFSLWLDSTGSRGYLSSTRSGTDQLFALTLNPPAFTVEGMITDATTGLPLTDDRTMLTVISANLDTVIMIDADGRFRLDLKPNTDYKFIASDSGMLSQSRMVSTKGLGVSTTLHAEIDLMPMVFDKAIMVHNIYYDYDKWDIRPDAALELDKLAKVFNDNPQLHFQLGSHTDSRGGDMYNLVLSDSRAKSAVDYLIRKGVDPDRLEARGFGETQLINGCVNGADCTEEEHQANRRTEFKVIDVGLSKDQ